MSTARYNSTGPNRFKLIGNMGSRAKAMMSLNSTSDAVIYAYGVSSIVGTSVGADTINLTAPFANMGIAGVVTSINSGRVGGSGNNSASQTGVLFFNPSTGVPTDTVCAIVYFGNLA